MLFTRASNQLHQQARYLTRYLSTSTATKLKPATISSNKTTQLALLLTTAGVASYTIHQSSQSQAVAKCAANPPGYPGLAKRGGDVVMLGPKEEPTTGILFPHLCNGMTFVGCGVRIKYGFVKVSFQCKMQVLHLSG